MCVSAQARDRCQLQDIHWQLTVEAEEPITAESRQRISYPDRAAEFAEKYFHQGMRVLITGRIQTGSYTNKDGQKVYTTDVIVEDQEFADSKGAGSGDNGGFAPGSRPMPAAAAPADGFMNLPIGVEDEGLPFGN